MQTSKYNLSYRYKDDQILVFNAFTRRFFYISATGWELVEDVIVNPNDYVSDSKYASLLNNLLENGFILDDGTDELRTLEEIFKRNKDEDSYTLLIMPTYLCNLSCWYCVQNHVNEFLTKEIEARLINHIRSYLINHQIKRFHISWFGGEPLLALDKIVSISECSKKILFV